jgi:lipoprotein-anchoring transpeptidase ErfK/SrfK
MIRTTKIGIKKFEGYVGGITKMIKKVSFCKLKIIISCLVVFAILYLMGCGSPIIPNRTKPMVNVYNGARAYCTKVGVKGLAREVNKSLVENEYIVGEPKNLSDYKVETEILFNPVDEDFAKDILEIVKVGKLLPQEEVSEGNIQIILGMDAVVPTFETLNVENMILVLNSTRRRGLAKRITVDIDNNLSKKYKFYTPDDADRHSYETQIYYPEELLKVANEAREAVGYGKMTAVENLKDVVVVLGLEFDPRTKARLGLTRDEDIPEIRIVIKKTDFMLRGYDLSGNLLFEYPVGIGKNQDLGDKKEVGDNRTPEGTFKVVSIEDSSSWIFEGEYAYGPWFIRLATQPWTGIGLHGTNEPEKIGTPTSRGCIRLHNEHLEKLLKVIKRGSTIEIRH